MTLYDFIEMAIDNCYDCYIWDNNKEKNLFEGKIDNIPEELLEHEITSWESYQKVAAFLTFIINILKKRRVVTQ